MVLMDNIDVNSSRYLDPEHFDRCPPKEEDGQTHVHEFLGSTRLAEQGEDRHNHRFAGVTSEAIPIQGGGHKHGLFTNTDFFIDHLHELATETGPAIPVGGGKHVHFVTARTTIDDGHFHEVVFATLIENPIG
ncbi:YmaF family protein [Tissierella sp. MSJ-40]|uniref:YmaF family protein n=2 Tax=Tissierella simiarum TaxID=2841534 RepID=A0ABS6EAN1_9FIRM|nr:YmaF family protein [Tissierella simiarum]